MIASLVGTAASSPAQICMGFPGNIAGSASFGVEGTDGASGPSFALSARQGRFALRIVHSRLDVFAMSDDRMNWSAEGTWAQRETSRGCFLTGVERTDHSADQHQSTQWDRRSNRRVEEHLIIGDYDRTRFSAGFSVGRELSAEGAFSAIPFASATLVLERETLSRVDGPGEARTRLVPAVQGGMSLRVHRLVLRSTLGNVFTEDDALSGTSNFAYASLSLGLTF